MTVAIIGSGIMAKQIIFRNLISGQKVVVLVRQVDKSQKQIDSYLSQKSTQIKLDYDLLKITSNVNDLHSMDLILECLPENLAIKTKLIVEVNKLYPHTIIATTTSSLTLQQLKQSMFSPSNLCLIHFSNPISKTKFAEICFAPDFSPIHRETVHKFLDIINVDWIKVPDISGFVLNRIIFSMLFEALQLESNYSISRIDINKTMKQGCGMPMGPFEIINLIGADTVRQVLLNLYPDSIAEINRLNI
jgi:3-hydroxybutyryl-CoA dehydrogenase